MQFAFRKFPKKSKRSCCKESCILWLLENCSQSQCHIFLYLCSQRSYFSSLFFGACACVHECKLLVIFFDFSLHKPCMHDSKAKQSILGWNEFAITKQSTRNISRQISCHLSKPESMIAPERRRKSLICSYHNRFKNFFFALSILCEMSEMIFFHVHAHTTFNSSS